MPTRALYTVEIGWNNLTASIFTIGSSTIGGTHRLSGIWNDTGYDNISAEVARIRFSRGRDGDGMVGAGELTLILHDATSKYNPNNPSSPLAGLLRPVRPVRVTALLNGTTYLLYYGYIQSITSNSDYGEQEAEIHCLDLLSLLALNKPTIASTGPTTTGVAIGRVLDTANLPLSLRDLDSGDAIPDFSADGSTTALDLIADLLKAERGSFYANGAGQAVYEDRGATWRAPRNAPQSTVTNTMRVLLPRSDAEQIRNRATVQRSGGVAQTWQDDESISWYGVRELDALTTPYLANDQDAQRLARWLVAQKKTPVLPVRTLELTSSEPSNYAALLARDLNDRVRVVEQYTNTAADFRIEALTQEITHTMHTCSWSLRRYDVGQAIILGTSAIGSGDLLVY